MAEKSAAKPTTSLSLKHLRKVGYHRDRGPSAARGLYLQVTASAAKDAAPGEVARSWVYRFVSPIHGRSRWMGLGPIDAVGLAEARQRAIAARKQVKAGLDPIDQREDERRAKAIEAAKRKTFGEVAKQLLDDRRDTWKNAKHAAQWETSLTTETKAINNLPVAAIDTPLVLNVLRPIWRKKPETASRIRSRIEAVLAYATVSEYRAGENPARWRGHLEHMLPKKNKIAPVEHHKALSYAELPAFMARLRNNESVSARALEFTILTAARTGETIGAMWNEIDLVAKTWTIPATRMKAGKEHRVPLSERAMKLLERLPREDNYLFIGASKIRPLSNMAMLELLRGMVGNGVTVHGMRSAFRDWCRERTSYPREIAELALAHVNKDKTEAAYARGDALDHRRKLMKAWADYLAAPPAKGDVVTPIRAQRST
jgi:integrase